MQASTARLKLLLDKVVSDYKLTRAKAGLLVSFVLILAQTLGLAFGSDVAEAIRDAVVSFAKQPMWVGGVVFLIFNVLLIGHAYLETRLEARRRIAAEAKPVELPRLSDQERLAIDHVRVFWRAYAFEASGNLFALVGAIHELLSSEYRLLHLLKYPVASWQEAQENVISALSSSGGVPLQDVRGRCERFFAEYMLIVRWVHHCVDMTPSSFSAGTELARLKRDWRAFHDEMLRELGLLTKREGLEAFDRIEVNILKLENERHPWPRLGIIGP